MKETKLCERKKPVYSAHIHLGMCDNMQLHSGWCCVDCCSKEFFVVVVFAFIKSKMLLFYFKINILSLAKLLTLSQQLVNYLSMSN